MGDVCIKSVIRDAGLEVSVAISTELARGAQQAHQLQGTPLIALGRLLTSTVLVALNSKKKGTTSLQLVSRGRIRQVFADVTSEGDVRGFVRTSSALPLGPMASGPRRSIGFALLPGKLSAIRSIADGSFTQSAVDLVHGEIDLDIGYFLEQSDQIPTAMSADVLVPEQSAIEVAGGFFAQALPGGDLDRLHRIREAISGRRTADLLLEHPDHAEDLLRSVAPDAVIVEHPAHFRWKCRCSYARVLDAVRMLGPKDLAEMVDEAEDVQVGCDLCSAKYTIPKRDLEQVFFSTIKAQG